MTDHRLVDPPALQAAVSDCFAGLGVPVPDADAVAEVLVYADLRGIESHGVYRAAAYLRRVRAGLAGGTGGMTQVGGSGAARRLDCAYALGPAAAVRATDLAVELAREHGTGVVALGRTTHLGAAGFYARRAARSQVVAIVLSNGPSGVAPHGAAHHFLGTNPIAIGIPLGRHGEFVLDMATSAIPRERIRMAAEAGTPIPAGVALDPDGAPTTDAAAAMAGSVLPVAGPKGSGLGLAVLLLAGMLGDAQFDDEVGSMYRDFDRPQDVGQVFWALDPWRLNARARAEPRVEAVVDRLHALLPVAGSDGVLFPGEGSEARARQRMADGLPMAESTLEDLADLCTEYGLTGQAARIRTL
ncbi:Ldh family oxidoreductase [Pseudonocardia sp.]|uniref:Ldh family oxidoreductase n=1 Tax=Pseudonocardia sp. TaxID=60912 RepID=UPI002620217C|nr:Ldh family oxidoreductase [Pseudonocardia sp.]